ncbi:MAG: GlmU family protein [Bacteroidetes bacterium]|nr:GlmU family protein [Bacteroidota bacterium]
MNYILFDDKAWDNLLPLTFTRPAAEIRAGILKISEKWEQHLNVKLSYLTKEYLQKKFPLVVQDENILINGSLLPDSDILESIQKLNLNEVLEKDNRVLAAKLSGNEVANFDYQNIDSLNRVEYLQETNHIIRPWDIFKNNEVNIKSDFELLTKERKTQKLSSTNQVIGEENIFIEEGAKVEFSILNASTGPIYIGKDAEIMENCVIRGPLALCNNSVLKMAAKIYGPTTIGPHSKVGGEVNNSVILGYSNKAHDGFLGNSVIGEWCNIGADTNNSNLKNNYAEVRLWNYESQRFLKTGLQFCGLIMGDHSKCAINTMFNTGTVVGVNANIFGEGFPRNFVASFSWGGAHGFTVYGINKAFEVAEKVMERRGVVLDETEKSILKEIFERTAKYRSF